MNPQLYFQLFACCLPVKGSSRSVVCDIQRNDYQLIPNILYDILIDYKIKLSKVYWHILKKKATKIF
jgi:hypothetical protein